MIEIREVKTKKQWKDFAAFPVKLYKDCPHYVPVFRSDDVNMANEKKNFSCKNCKVKAFLAYKDGVLSGRIAGIIVNDSNELYNQKNVRISRFDFVEDIEVAKALLDAVEKFGKENGMDTLHGPWGFNDTDREGMLTEGFDETATYATNYNFEYYPKFMRELGFDDESVWVEQRLFMPEVDSKTYDRYVKLGEYVKRKFKLRDISEEMSVKKVIKEYGDKFFDCFNEAYKSLDMYVEIKEDAKKVVLRQFATVVNPKFYSVLVNENDDVVAFGIVLPAIGPALKKHGGKMTLSCLLQIASLLKNPKGLELTLVAVRPEYAKLGYTAACLGKALRETVKAGFKDVVTDPTLLSNTAVRAQWDQIPHETIKRRQTFKKAI